MKKLDAVYWNSQYLNQQTGWDIGYASPAIIEYFQQIENKSASILIPGAGHGWEAEKLWTMGFKNLFVLDFSEKAQHSFKTRVPDFPDPQILVEDFFHHQGCYDYIVEQTFFSSLPLDVREAYIKQVHKILKPQGRLIGLLFNHHFSHDGPPFGASASEYEMLFSPYFRFQYFNIAYNSIKARNKRELFILFKKREVVVGQKQ